MTKVCNLHTNVHTNFDRKTMPTAAGMASRSPWCAHGGRRLPSDSTAKKDGEDRYKVIGIVDGKLWTAVHVRRGDMVRFISVRRSNDGEEKQYRA